MFFFLAAYPHSLKLGSLCTGIITFFFSFSFFERSHCPDPYNEKTTSDEETFSLRNKRDFELTLPDLPPKNSTYENIAKL